jgi:vacuolar-type H+-ATPase subunit I/STV1
MAAASRRWRDTILGHEEEVSEENEKACKESVGEICEVVINRAGRGIEAVQEEMRTESEEWYRKVLVAVELLWLEERAVAEAMLIA